MIGTSHMVRRCLMAAALALAFAAPALALDDTMTPLPTPPQPNAIVLGTGPLPGATVSESWYRQYDKDFARNVTVATLTPFLPDPAKASGAAVIVAPGGGFMTLSMQNEGSDVARALAARGVAAFVLKYRTRQTPASLDDFAKSMAAMFAGAARPPKAPHGDDLTANLGPQLADARAAFALVRKRAAEWHINPDRIGMVGFSAGAGLTMATTLDGEAKPAFIGIIYGPMAAVKVPPEAPPLFVALAADDPIFGNSGFGLVESWRAAKRPVEFHLYEQGGHGFGMYPKTTTSTGWFDAFARWLGMHGMLNYAKMPQSE